MATFGEVLEVIDDRVNGAMEPGSAWDVDKRAAWAMVLPQMMHLGTDLQRREALLLRLEEKATTPWQRRKWRIHREAILELMAMLGLKPAEDEHDLLV